MNPFFGFPSLLGHSAYAVFLVRIVLGLTLLYFGYLKVAGKGHSSGSNSPMYGVIEIVIALLLVVGLFTQIAAILNALILVIKLGLKAQQGKFLSDGVNYYILLLTLALAMVFLGSGAWAIDGLF